MDLVILFITYLIRQIAFRMNFQNLLYKSVKQKYLLTAKHMPGKS